ncbi:membrane-bound lytic murein transglycosylase F [Psychroflexus torquis ATCC 700755]|uniref:Membrane-bound lytic murein transglycosylase F n=1 Tax=Psychroflexus torquis (strain ATCC 700755 / CIP 106069 / ACAM 623) TaxID=313595 RepID=K4IIR8_PSYTT|nr:transporter substrate-binding domain-containing protein [Psychroflexus torquis]AFU70457.1 membrane-bound lytic murein transglycosylase F [Psychroflexus torquis ATCC 700755]
MKKIFLLLLFINIGCQSNSEEHKEIEDSEKFSRDLQDIKESGKLKALTIYSGTTYFLYKGRPMGFEYELLKRMAKDLDVELEMVVAKDENDLIKLLQEGEGDLLAYGYTITEDRKRKINFTTPLYLSHQVLIQKKPENWRRMKLHEIKKQLVTNAVELINDTISVKRNSSYASRIKNLSNELGGPIIIDTLKGTLSTDKIIKKVVDGDIKFTIADENIAFINSSYYPILDISTSLSLSQRIGWAVRKTDTNLLAAVNQWLEKAKKTTDYHVIYNKYFKNKRLYKSRVISEFYSLNENKISPYDDILKENADRIEWDWRLLASVAYQESQFKPNRDSWAGASGLMQIMPATAKELGITDPYNPNQSLKAGATYLKQMLESHSNVKDSIQKIKFALGSYNCGLYHVKDAQKLAKTQGLDPLIWDDNVELSLLDLSFPEHYNKSFIKYGYVRGEEPYNYVKEIFERLEHYKKFIDN